MKRGAAAIRVGTLAGLMAGVFNVSCSRPIPPVPAVSLEGLDPDVRAVIEKSRDQAVAEAKSGQASGRFGMVLEAHTLYLPAALAFERAIRLDPQQFAWRYYLAVAQEYAAQPEQALAAVTDALRIRPDYKPAVLKRGALLLKLGRFQESEAVLKPLLAQNPGSAETLYTLGRVKFAQGDFPAAEDLYRRASEAYPTYGAAWFGLAEAGRRLGHNEESERSFRLAESYKDRNPPSEDELLREMLKLATGIENRLAEAKRLMDRRQFDEASRIYKEVLTTHPDNIDSLVNLLYMAQFPNQSSPEEVEALYATASRVSPDVPQVYLYYGTALAAQGKYEAAAAAIEKGIALKPDDGEAQSWLADIMMRQHRPAQAIEHYRRALTVDPSFRPARLMLAQLLINTGRSGEAIPVLLPALQRNDKVTPLFLMTLAQAYANTGDPAKAIERLKQARPLVVQSGPPNLLAQIDQGLAQLGSHP
ncbi:MAG TPA: tetratricopeptide repeat protein [Bryobacteraceae bacterium]|nr:tetratricopeptide repeat protein [Bryobacteraceae bacterium]